MIGEFTSMIAHGLIKELDEIRRAFAHLYSQGSDFERSTNSIFFTICHVLLQWHQRYL